MTRKFFERKLYRLEVNTLALGSIATTAINASVTALAQRDIIRAQQIVANDWVINAARFELETDCLKLIATQQPRASDLRRILAIIGIAIELERICDYAKSIAKINIALADETLIKPLVDIPQMAATATAMLQQALIAFSQRDAPLARRIPKEDDEVDALYLQVYRELMTYVIANPAHIEQSNYLLWVAHNLERAADRVTNICERVIFMVTGELMELEDNHWRPVPSLNYARTAHLNNSAD
ncbi:MAG: phosphate signaling complex protein PhoU [Anaerolineae bacterium]|nr:phosphate signaling complex protein PhoU [Anaerolineae bacterium]MCO5188568.1 phosphate signaling complex protein PhoU [Anaerolineae bacterium]MCO5194983.1 phosphate signaling complex protein PhoU [Anaerolineae bacterium]